MSMRGTFLVLAGLAALSACGGSSVSSVPSDSSNPNPTAASSTVASSVAPETSVAPVTVAVDPANLLIDSSLDIAAIEGPVVLWFWAPG